MYIYYSFINPLIPTLLKQVIALNFTVASEPIAKGSLQPMGQGQLTLKGYSNRMLPRFQEPILS